MYLVAGLGNPGANYKKTRHNIGFQFLDYLTERHGLCFKESKWNADVVKASLWGQPLLLVKPQTFMNRSGQAVAAIARFYRIASEKVIVIHDELDLQSGRLKIVRDRGPGGHNGIRSIIENLGAKDFTRIRMGIGRPTGPIAIADYVLSKFSKQEGEQLDICFTDAERGLMLIVEQGVASAMNEINSAK